MADMVERLMMRAEVDGSVRELCHDAADALESAVREIQELRDAVATLRHAADLQAEAMAERDAEVQRLQALIDAWAVASLSWQPGAPMPDSLIAAEQALFAAKTPKAGGHV